MKFRLVSDLHLDFSWYDLPKRPEDKNTVLLVPGDICESTHIDLLDGWLRIHSPQFLKIVIVLGNHDYYGSSLDCAVDDVCSICAKYSNVIILDNDTYTIGDVTIIGTTLWSDFDNENPMIMRAVGLSLGDYSLIKSTDSSGYITPAQILALHKAQKSKLIYHLEAASFHGKKVIVMTHHAPTWKSVTEKFIGDSLNGGFVSDLSELILKYSPSIWVHGHVHSFHDYMVGDTRVLCNSRGYVSRYGSEDTGFIPDFGFEI